MKTAVFTIASKNYLPYARALFESVQRHHPECGRYLCLADEIDGYFDPLEEEFQIVLAEQLKINTFLDMTIRYDIMEFNTSVKPFMIDWLFKNTDTDIVIYLDPDIRLFSRMDLLELKFKKGASVILTPHITKPLEDGLNPSDYNMLQSGVFNLGFIALQRCEEAINFVEWWGERLKVNCASDLKKNLFTDQRWCDLAPCFLDKLEILKDPGFNVAYWNLSQRNVMFSDYGTWIVNGQPLVFFHFSGISAEKRNIVSKHQNRFDWDDIKPIQSLFTDYIESLIKFGWSACKRWPYAYDHFNDDFAVSTIMRMFFREKKQLSIFIEYEDIPEYITKLCNQTTENIRRFPGTTITDFMVFIYRLRPDLQSIFCLDTIEGQRGFSDWFETAAHREYLVPNGVSSQYSIIENQNKIEKKNFA